MKAPTSKSYHQLGISPTLSPISLFNSQFSVDGGTEYFNEYDESTQKSDDHTETPWENEANEISAENRNDLNGYMRFLKKTQ